MNNTFCLLNLISDNSCSCSCWKKISFYEFLLLFSHFRSNKKEYYLIQKTFTPTIFILFIIYSEPKIYNKISQIFLTKFHDIKCTRLFKKVFLYIITVRVPSILNHRSISQVTYEGCFIVLILLRQLIRDRLDPFEMTVMQKLKLAFVAVIVHCEIAVSNILWLSVAEHTHTHIVSISI